ncbi:MAG: hypothetical protein ACO1SX_10465 [Actinomycetota bacterium]
MSPARRAACAALTISALCLTLSASHHEALAAKPKPKAKPKAKAAPALSMPSVTGRITYSFNVAPLTGSSIVTWADGGKKFRQDMKMSGTAPGAPAGASLTNVEMWMIGDGTHLYSHQPMMGKQVLRTKIPKGAATPGPAGLPLGAKPTGKLIGKATILGKPCEIRQVETAKVWLWKGLALKMENQGGQGMAMTMTATKLQMPYKSSPGLFKVPTGYTVTDKMPAMGGMGGGGAAPPVRKGSQ